MRSSFKSCGMAICFLASLIVYQSSFADSIEEKSAIEFDSLSKIQRKLLKDFIKIHAIEVCRKLRAARGSYYWDTASIDDVRRAQETGSPDSYKYVGRNGVIDFNAHKKWTTKGAAWLGTSCVITKVSVAGTNTQAFSDDFEVWATDTGIQMFGSVTGKGMLEGYDAYSGGVPWAMTWGEAYDFEMKYLKHQENENF